MSTSTVVQDAAQEALAWFLEDLLPFWAAHGRYPSGGFVERIGTEGPVDLPLRCRVACRQIYVFCEAGRLGWTGPWREIVDSGLAFLLASYAREDGLMRATVDPAGKPVDERADNYDQAFALFALAHAYRVTGRTDLKAHAQALLDRLWALHGHPAAGLWEGQDRQPPLHSNPHMHLLEAMLAWMEAGVHEDFATRAEEIADLAAHHFIDPASGALHEHFDAHWQRLDDPRGNIVEPGHQFEWAWLLDRCAAMIPGTAAGCAERLYRLGTDHGIDAQRGVTINQIDKSGNRLDDDARLWPQTERIKAALRLGTAEEAVAAWRGLRAYADPQTPGLFFDIQRPDGRFVPGPALASSLYHIAGAVVALATHHVTMKVSQE